MVERIPVRLTRPELAILDRYLEIRYVLARDYCDREAPSMLRCPVGGCGIDLLRKNGIINPRCAKAALQSHFNIHHRDGKVYNFKVALKRGFRYTRLPNINTLPLPQNTTDEYGGKGKGGKGAGRFGRQRLVSSLQEPLRKGEGSGRVFKELEEIPLPVEEKETEEKGGSERRRERPRLSKVLPGRSHLREVRGGKTRKIRFWSLRQQKRLLGGKRIFALCSRFWTLKSGVGAMTFRLPELPGPRRLHGHTSLTGK